MNSTFILYALLYALGVFLAAVSQVLLKKEAMKEHDSIVSEYVNPLVAIAYAILVATTLMTIVAYKVIPVSLGSVLEATSYFYVTIFGVLFFKEKITPLKAIAIGLIVVGIAIFATGLPT